MVTAALPPSTATWQATVSVFLKQPEHSMVEPGRKKRTLSSKFGGSVL